MAAIGVPFSERGRRTDCPRGTTCIPVHNGSGMAIGSACLLDMTSAQNGGKANGMTCTFADYCVTGDICNGSQATFRGSDGHTYTVQKEWSNQKGACIAHK